MTVSGRVAIFDLDDTLADMRSTSQPHLIEATGINVEWNRWHALSAQDLFKLTADQFLDILMKHDVLERMQPHPEAKDFLTEFRAAGGKVMILTARGWHPRAREVTTQWLLDHEMPFDHLEICTLQSHKEEYIGDMKPLYTVDDSVKHCLGYAKSGLVEHVFCYNMPWNLAARKGLEKKGVKCIDNLYEIHNHTGLAKLAS